ncbi:hypothetical protein Tco_0640036 [Tanacetum coccineum]
MELGQELRQKKEKRTKVMEFESAQNYALWEVIENGNSWVFVPKIAQENGTSVTKMSVPVTAEEKTNKKNDVKARSSLLMALPNEHQLTFSQYSDAKTMLQKIISRLAILGVVITQEDLNLNFLRSLPPEWNTHVGIAEIDQNPSISWVQDEGTSWIQEDAKIQGRTSFDTEILLDQEEPTELVGDLGSGEKGKKEISTANISVSTASVTPEVSNTAKNLVYIRRSAEKRKDKGKAIMKEDESVQKKTKKQLDQERLGHEEAKRLQEQINEEERQKIARDAEIAKYKKISREDSDKDNAKKQKLEDDAEKEELRDSMDVVPRDDIAIDVESLATKYPIVEWKTHVLTENMMYYQIIKVDGSSKNYKIFCEMLDDFDRQDVMDLYRLVQESWRLFDSCGIHMLLMHTGIAIHMMIEKKYPLTQEMLSRMLSRRLEVDHESEMTYELLRFIRSQLQK